MITAQLDAKQVAKINRMLTALPKKIRNKILREELRKGAKTLLPASKAATPARTGKLRRSVKVRAVKRSRKAVGVLVGYNDKAYAGDTFYGAFLEWGWKQGKRPSRTVRGGASDNRKEIPGRRMLGNVAEAKGPGVLDAVINQIASRIQTEARNA
jgi:HK97 gp10 family phage protein